MSWCKKKVCGNCLYIATNKGTFCVEEYMVGNIIKDDYPSTSITKDACDKWEYYNINEKENN